MEKNGRVIQNGTVVQKTEQWYNNTPFRFCSVVEKRNRSEKTEQWYKNTLFRFFVPLWKKRNSGAKNGTVVQKHTVPFFVPL